MPSSLPDRALAARLAGAAVVAMDPAGRGGNNRVFRVRTADGRLFALKHSPLEAEDRRDRLGTEMAGLRFLRDHGIASVPRPVAADQAARCALYEWIDGEPPAAAETAVDAMGDFLAGLQALRAVPEAGHLRPASDAAFSGAEALANLRRRRLRFTEPARYDADLAAILAEVDAATEEAGARLDDSPVPRILSPSDLGLHNMLRRPDGSYAFVDFEYFGWDGATKAVADAMLHAGSDLSPELADRFRRRVGPVFSALDSRFEALLANHWPLFALAWCLICLNEFLPGRLERRQRLRGDAADRQAIRARQLAKARRMLDRAIAGGEKPE